MNSPKIQRLAAWAKDRTPRKTVDHDNLAAIEAAVQWLFRAQDGTPDRGVSHSYLIGEGWMPSYPETTGYIIPTLLNWSFLSGNPEAQTRALEMATWESEVQLPDGAVQASVVGLQKARPAVFNTGQAIFGWLSAYKRSGKDACLESATKATRWLRTEIGDDPTWRRHGSMGEPVVHTFNVRTAWAVIELAQELGDSAMLAPMKRVLDWSLEQEQGPGWFLHNCLDDNDHPLLHTIAYTARGFLESGKRLGEERYVLAATRTASALLEHVRADGWMPARYGRQFAPAARFCCLTGVAQMSIVWHGLHEITGDPKFREASSRVNRFLRANQDLGTSHPGIHGGLKGSRPVDAPYGRYRVLNWATKFLIDALILEEHPRFRSSTEYCVG